MKKYLQKLFSKNKQNNLLNDKHDNIDNIMKSNDKKLLYDYGDLYYDEKKYRTAKKMYKKAYELDNIDINCDSITNLGLMYHFGEGTRVNYKKAFFYYKEAIVIGQNSRALNNIAILYANGTGIKKNKDIANIFFIEAVKKYRNKHSIQNIYILNGEEKGRELLQAHNIVDVDEE